MEEEEKNLNVHSMRNGFLYSCPLFVVTVCLRTIEYDNEYGSVAKVLTIASLFI